SRGVELNFVDLRNPLPPGDRKLMQETKDSIEATRKRVRQGQLPVDDYVQARREIIQRLRDAAKKQ
ncbi:MAG: hypothetical protein ACT4TC_14575, partial [Myxococcaceae bacterium]